jgi:hypothetical protein
MLSFKSAIQQWEYPFNEKMIGYSALTRKACNDPHNIFIIGLWDAEQKYMDVKSFNVGLEKKNSRWVVDEKMFECALAEKIEAIEYSNSIGKTNIGILYRDEKPAGENV